MQAWPSPVGALDSAGKKGQVHADPVGPDLENVAAAIQLPCIHVSKIAERNRSQIQAKRKEEEGRRKKQTKEKANKKGRKVTVMWVQLNSNFSMVTLVS